MSRKKQSDAIDLWEDTPKEISKDNSYLVLAGINKRTDRQLYLSTFEDSDEWSISVVPSKMSYKRATHMMNKAIEDLIKNEKLRLRYGEHEFAIVPWLP